MTIRFWNAVLMGILHRWEHETGRTMSESKLVDFVLLSARTTACTAIGAALLVVLPRPVAGIAFGWVLAEVDLSFGAEGDDCDRSCIVHLRRIVSMPAELVLAIAITIDEANFEASVGVFLQCVANVLDSGVIGLGLISASELVLTVSVSMTKIVHIVLKTRASNVDPCQFFPESLEQFVSSGLVEELWDVVYWNHFFSSGLTFLKDLNFGVVSTSFSLSFQLG